MNMTLYGRFIMAGAIPLLGIAAPAMAQSRPEKPNRDPYASRTYSPYSNASVRRERAARATAKAIRADERRERVRPSRYYPSDVMDSIDESRDDE